VLKFNLQWCPISYWIWRGWSAGTVTGNDTFHSTRHLKSKKTKPKTHRAIYSLSAFWSMMLHHRSHVVIIIYPQAMDKPRHEPMCMSLR